MTMLDCLAHCGAEVIWSRPDGAVMAIIVGVGLNYALVRHGAAGAKAVTSCNPATLALAADVARQLVDDATRAAVEGAST